MKKRLAVIGGGAAGVQIAYQLRDLMDVTLIDPKTYWEIPMALPRLLVAPTTLQARLPFASVMPAVRRVQGRAVHMTDRDITVDAADGRSQTVNFDFAVIASGSRYLDPLIKAESATEGERSAQILAAHEALKNATRVVVAGGGPVGVETAAELRETFPHLAVTLVHGAQKLLDTAPSKFGGWAATQLQQLGVSLVLNDKVAEPPIGTQPVNGRVLTQQGRALDADVVVWAAGTRPNTDFVARSWPSLVQPDGFIKTDPHLRLQGHPNIFVAGDVTNLPEGRLAVTVTFHVPAIVASLKTLLTAASPAAAQLKPYVPKRPGHGMGKMMIVTLGRHDGMSSLPFGQFRASFLARKIKSEDMLVGRYRKMLGLT